MWIQIALFIASLVISYALQPKQPKPKAAAFSDFDFPTVDDGTPQIVVFGDVWLTDWCVIGIGNYRNQPIVAKQAGLFGSKKSTTGFRYLMSIHMGICRGLDNLVEIKMADRTAWSGIISAEGNQYLNINQPDLFGGDKAEGGIVGELSILRGADQQYPLSQLKVMYENEDIPAYRGVTTFFYDGLICSNSPYPKPWSFRVQRTNSDWDGSVWYPSKSVIWLNENTIKSMNPAHILYQVQTDRYWGRGFADNQLDLVSFQIAADQLYSEGFGLCLGWRRQNSLNEFIQEVLNTIGAALYVDRLTGLWRLQLIRDNYIIEDLQSFDYTNGLLEITEDNNSSSDLVSNQIVVTYRDPISNEDKTAYSENIAAIQRHGVILENKNYAGIPTAALAGRIAARDLKITQSSLKRFKLILDKRAYAIQPASLFKINIPQQGIESIVVRVLRVDHDTVTNGKITITVVQDVFGLPATNYVQEQVSLHNPPIHTAVPIKKVDVEFKYFDASYYDLCSQFTDGAAKPMFRSAFYYAAIAKAPNPLHFAYKLWIRQRYYDPVNGWKDSGFVDCCTSGNFCPVGKIITPLAYAYEQTTVQIDISIELLKTIQLNTAAMVDEEIMRVDAINLQNSTITLSRGCSDSVVNEHAAQTEIWFYDEAISVSSKVWNSRVTPEYTNDIYLKFETQTRYDRVKVQPYDNNDVFKFGFYTLLSRAFRPYPPAHVLFKEQLCLPGRINYLAQPFNLITWRNRNRIVQADQLYAQSDESIDIEPSCYTELVISIKNLDGWFSSAQSFNLGGASQVNPLSLMPSLLNVHAANFLLRTRLPETSGNDPSISVYMIDVEFFGFGVNFGRHFGAYNG